MERHSTPRTISAATGLGRAAGLAVALAVLVALTGCKGDAAEAPAPGAATPDEGAPVEADDPLHDPARVAPDVAAEEPAGLVTVRLISEGSEPRRVLRLEPEKDATERAAVTLSLDAARTVGGQAAAGARLPRARIPLVATIDEVSEREIGYSIRVESVEVDDGAEAGADVVATIKAGLEGVTGVEGRGVLNRRGVARAAELDLPDDASVEVQQLLEGFKQALAQMAVPLPEEAVGPGARWEVVQTVSQGPLDVTQTAIFELISLEGTRLEARVDLRQTADVGEGPVAAAPGAEVVSFEGKGKGQATLDLRRLLPVASSADVETEVRMRMGAGDEKVDVVMRMRIGMTLESSP